MCFKKIKQIEGNKLANHDYTTFVNYAIPQLTHP